MKPSTNLRELRARMEQGFATAGDARVLFAYLDHLVWERKRITGVSVEVCRHCGTLRGKDHPSECIAAEVV